MDFSASTPQPFPWVRYWRVSQAGSDEEALDENDFLYLPDTPKDSWKHILGFSIHPLMELLPHRCLVLLGRPGSGKTTELALLKSAFDQTEEKLLCYDAKTFDGTTAELCGEVEGEIQAGNKVRLVLDGADEWQQHDPRFLGALEERLKKIGAKHGPEPLRMIISSRAAEWNEGTMSSLFSPADRVVAKLCQLDRQAARAFVASHLSGRQDAFWEAVRSVKGTFLCVWPHSLKSLVEAFDVHGRLPGTLFELVLQTAQMRCDVHYGVTDPQRARRLRNANADPKWMFRLACRAAAMGVFSGQTGLVATPDPLAVGGVLYHDLGATDEPWSAEPVRTIQPEDINDLGRTAVFERCGERLVFSHQLMREFLASRWLVDRRFSQGQLANLFGRWEDGGEWRHYPQLAAISAWLASDPAKKEWREFLLVHDPAVLIRSDSANLPDQQKKDIAEALLKQAVKLGASDSGWEHRHLRSLACDGLADILRPYLNDLSPSVEAARDLAIDIAWEARVEEVVPDLWEVLRIPDAPLRSDIAYALSDLANEGFEDHWMEVLNGSIPLDRNGSLLGVALEHLVPKILKVRHVLPSLIPEKDFGIIGRYDAVHAALVDCMERDDALPVVRYSAEHFAAGFGSGWKTDTESFLSKALKWVAEELPKREPADALAEWWLAAIMYHRHLPRWDDEYPSMSDLGFIDPAKRHAVLEAALAHPDFQRFDSNDPVWFEFEEFARSPENRDVDWLISKLDTEKGKAKLVLARFLSGAFYAHRTGETRKKLLKAYNSHSELRERLPEVTKGPDIFGHIEAERQEHEAKQAQKSAEVRKRLHAREAAMESELETLWERSRALADSGDPNAWLDIWRVTNATRYRRERGSGADRAPDAIVFEDWMRPAARRWLLEDSANHTPNDAGDAAAAALNLCWSEIVGLKNWQSGIHPGWWRVILSTLLYTGGRHTPLSVKRCLEHFREPALNGILGVFRNEYVKGGELWSIAELTPAGSVGVDGLKDLLLQEPLNPKAFANAIAWLAKVDLDAAEAVAKTHLHSIPTDRFDEGDARIVGAMMVHLQGRLWPDIKDKLERQLDWQKTALLAGFTGIGWDIESKIDLQAWPAPCLAEVVRMMLLAFPPASDPESREGTVTALDQVINARNRMISVLGNRGLAAEVRQLESLGLHGTQRWFRSVQLSASRNATALKWKPVPPKDLLALADCQDTRLVRSIGDLMRAALEAVRRYQQAIQHTEHGHALINDDGSPKEEERLSDQLCLWLKEHLQLAGVRESQTSRGNREDITLIVSPPGAPPLELTIEVKKDRSAELLQKMETQLLAKYLQAQGRTHGIYAVFWFEDKKRGSHPGVSTFEQLEVKLAEQARQLSSGPFKLESIVIDCRGLRAGKRAQPARRKKPNQS